MSDIIRTFLDAALLVTLAVGVACYILSFYTVASWLISSARHRGPVSRHYGSSTGQRLPALRGNRLETLTRYHRMGTTSASSRSATSMPGGSASPTPGVTHASYYDPKSTSPLPSSFGVFPAGSPGPVTPEPYKGPHSATEAELRWPEETLWVLKEPSAGGEGASHDR